MQRFRPLFTASLLLMMLAGTNVRAGNPYLIDQRDPGYQKAIEHLAQASHALSIAKRELAAASGAYNLPGLNVEQMRDQLKPVEDTLKVLLSPEKKRHAQQTLVPDGLFFTPITTGD